MMSDEHRQMERHIDDQVLQSFLLTRGTLTPEQVNAALAAQHQTGHSLWRELIDMQLLTPQEMSDIIQTLTVESEARGAPVITRPAKPEREWHALHIDDSITAVELVNTIFEGAVHARATDIHIEPQTPRMRIRYRIDGMLFDVMAVPTALEMSVISRLKVLADMDITERRLPQDGHMTMTIDGQEYNIRLATIPTTHGEKLVLRLLSKHNVITGLKQLGLEAEDERRLQLLIAKPQGMILARRPLQFLDYQEVYHQRLIAVPRMSHVFHQKSHQQTVRQPLLNADQRFSHTAPWSRQGSDA